MPYACLEILLLKLESEATPKKRIQEMQEEALTTMGRRYPDKASHISGHVCDLSQLDYIEANLTTLLQYAAKGGKIDHIIFTAGDALSICPVAEITVESIQKIGTVRFFGSLILAKLCPAYLSPGPKSSITLTGGSNSHRPIKGWTTVVAWGSGLEGAARGLAVDLAPTRVNLVSLGAVHTELWGDIPKERLEGVLQRFKDASLVGKVGTPEEVAEAYLYSMKNEFVTGSVIQSDGGRLLK